MRTSYYDLLAVPPTASQEEILGAYKALASRGESTRGADEAAEVLLDKDRRVQYDRELLSELFKLRRNSEPRVSTPDSPSYVPGGIRDYKDVPFLRRSAVLRAMGIIGALVCIPLFLVVVLMALSGDVYEKTTDENGYLKKWGASQKRNLVIAGIVLTAFMVLMFWMQFSSF